MAKNSEQEGLQFKNYLEIIRRRKWITVTFFVVLVTAVAIGTFRQTPVYRATATVLVQKESPRVLSFKDVVTLGEQYDYKDYYQTQLKIIKSRTIAEKVISRLELTEASPSKTPPAVLPSPRRGWVQRFSKKPGRNPSPNPIAQLCQLQKQDHGISGT